MVSTATLAARRARRRSSNRSCSFSMAIRRPSWAFKPLVLANQVAGVPSPPSVNRAAKPISRLGEAMAARSLVALAWSVLVPWSRAAAHAAQVRGSKPATASFSRACKSIASSVSQQTSHTSATAPFNPPWRAR